VAVALEERVIRKGALEKGIKRKGVTREGGHYHGVIRKEAITEGNVLTEGDTVWCGAGGRRTLSTWARQ